MHVCSVISDVAVVSKNCKKSNKQHYHTNVINWIILVADLVCQFQFASVSNITIAEIVADLWNTWNRTVKKKKRFHLSSVVIIMFLCVAVCQPVSWAMWRRNARRKIPTLIGKPYVCTLLKGKYLTWKIEAIETIRDREPVCSETDWVTCPSSPFPSYPKIMVT